MTDVGTTARLTYLNRLLAGTDGWASAGALLADFCIAFVARSAGVRWPADGPAVLLAETARVSGPTFQHRFELADGSTGIFWADGSATDSEFLTVAANAVGRSPALCRFLGPVADQSRVAQRLDDAGRVAQRVGHDLGNVFQAVGGFLSLALDVIERDSAAYPSLVEADAAARLVPGFCEQLHQLGRSGLSRPSAATVGNAVAREVTRVTKAHPKLKVETDVAGDLQPVGLDGGGLQLLLGHLLDNAAEATPADGPVRVAARLVELVPADLAGYLCRPSPGPKVELTIQDAGPGLSDDARRRVFVEPFFTTKARHRGLGLAVVFRVLYAHRGGVRVEGGSSRGTTVKVVVPLAAARQSARDSGRNSGGSV